MFTNSKKHDLYLEHLTIYVYKLTAQQVQRMLFANRKVIGNEVHVHQFKVPNAQIA